MEAIHKREKVFEMVIREIRFKIRFPKNILIVHLMISPKYLNFRPSCRFFEAKNVLFKGSNTGKIILNQGLWDLLFCIRNYFLKTIDNCQPISYCYRFGNGIYMFQIGLKNRK